MDFLFLLLAVWTIYSIYNNVVKYKDYKYVLVLFLSGLFLSFLVKNKTWWLFFTLLVTNLYYAYLMFKNVSSILGPLLTILQKNKN